MARSVQSGRPIGITSTAVEGSNRARAAASFSLLLALAVAFPVQESEVVVDNRVPPSLSLVHGHPVLLLSHHCLPRPVQEACHLIFYHHQAPPGQSTSSSSYFSLLPAPVCLSYQPTTTTGADNHHACSHFFPMLHKNVTSSGLLKPGGHACIPEFPGQLASLFLITSNHHLADAWLPAFTLSKSGCHLVN